MHYDNYNLHCVDFYPRSPCGERPAIDVFLAVWAIISIHALLAESDVSFMLYDTTALIFLSTLSLRRATDTSSLMKCQVKFLSTLSLRRATLGNVEAGLHMSNFYPRSPCGERRRRSVKLFRQNYISIHALLAESDVSIIELIECGFVFLSTLSLRRATDARRALGFVDPISIHALLAESDRMLLIRFSPAIFLSTLSLRRATWIDGLRA